MKFNWNSQRGGEIIGKNPFLGGGMDIFWKYTSPRRPARKSCLNMKQNYGFHLIISSTDIKTYSSNTANVAETGCFLRFSGTSLFSDGTGVCVSSSILTE